MPTQVVINIAQNEGATQLVGPFGYLFVIEPDNTKNIWVKSVTDIFLHGFCNETVSNIMKVRTFRDIVVNTEKVGNFHYPIGLFECLSYRGIDEALPEFKMAGRLIANFYTVL